jgi:predicted transcriptional regulator
MFTSDIPGGYKGRLIDRRKELMRDVELAEVRRRAGLTQGELADLLEVTQANISRIEHQEDLYLSTLRGYVEALGGKLQLRAVFDDAVIDLELAQD